MLPPLVTANHLWCSRPSAHQIATTFRIATTFGDRQPPLVFAEGDGEHQRWSEATTSPPDRFRRTPEVVGGW